MDFASEPKESKLRDELYTIAETEGPEALHERLKRISPKSAERVHPNNIKRVVRAIEAAESGEPIGSISELPLRNKYEYTLIGLTRDRE